MGGIVEAVWETAVALVGTAAHLWFWFAASLVVAAVAALVLKVAKRPDGG